MIRSISTPEQAEKILREAVGKQETLIFDVAPGLHLHDIPLTLRKCSQGCDYEYLGWNIWGQGWEMRTTYCKKCGYALNVLAEVSITMQGDKVLLLNFRDLEKFYPEKIPA